MRRDAAQRLRCRSQYCIFKSSLMDVLCIYGPEAIVVSGINGPSRPRMRLASHMNRNWLGVVVESKNVGCP